MLICVCSPSTKGKKPVIYLRNTTHRTHIPVTHIDYKLPSPIWEKEPTSLRVPVLDAVGRTTSRLNTQLHDGLAGLLLV
jgi:hypothetical protein